MASRCTQCDRSFRSTRDLFAHCRDKDDHPFCKDCDRLFSTFQGLTHVRELCLQRRKLTHLFTSALAKLSGASRIEASASCSRFLLLRTLMK